MITGLFGGDEDEIEDIWDDDEDEDEYEDLDGSLEDSYTLDDPDDEDDL